MPSKENGTRAFHEYFLLFLAAYLLHTELEYEEPPTNILSPCDEPPYLIHLATRMTCLRRQRHWPRDVLVA